MFQLTPDEKKDHLWRMLEMFLKRGNKVSAQKLNSDWFKLNTENDNG